MSEIATLNIQFTPEEHAFPVLLAHSGYISELTVQGIGPIPMQHTNFKCQGFISIEQFQIKAVFSQEIVPIASSCWVND